VRGLNTKDYKGAKVGNIWVGTDGYLVCPSYSGGVAYDKAGKEVAKFNGGNDQYHFDNFVKAVRSRKVEDLNCDIAEGHLSAALCHLANISYRSGTELPLSKAAAVSNDKTVNEFAARMGEHLKENKVDVEGTKGRFGPSLAIDVKTEKFTNHEKANAMLFREYRKGFELKEVV
ncbi:MAG TPA: gfo/Idh/MocA family oxidoreductase, partial [Gemmata sp.]|nr:gfo/Idh/MocA family oxidoreductase [Gemmata sp.]